MALVRTAEQLERWTDMVMFMKQYVGMNAHLSPDDRVVFAATYKQRIRPIRNHLAFLDILIGHLNSKQKYGLADQVRHYRMGVLGELQSVCKDCADVVDNELFPATQSFDDQIFYLWLKGDVYRYVCEFTTDKDTWNPTKTALDCYERALDMARRHLMPVNPMVLNLVMNYCVFIEQIMGRKDDAIAETKKLLASIQETVEDNGKEVVTDEAREIIKRIRANVDIWMSQDDVL